jgi:hypothetical protein
MKKFLFTPLLLSTVLACSCIAVKDKDVVGTYKAAFLKSQDTLIVNQNHTYIYRDQNMSHTGKWQLKGNSLYFNDFKFSPAGLNSIWVANVVLQDNEVRIMYADEEGCYYDKIKPATESANVDLKQKQLPVTGAVPN